MCIVQFIAYIVEITYQLLVLCITLLLEIFHWLLIKLFTLCGLGLGKNMFYSCFTGLCYWQDSVNKWHWFTLEALSSSWIRAVRRSFSFCSCQIISWLGLCSMAFFKVMVFFRCIFESLSAFIKLCLSLSILWKGQTKWEWIGESN